MDLALQLRFIEGHKVGTLFINKDIRVRKIYSLVREFYIKKPESFILIYGLKVLEPYGRLREYIKNESDNNNIELVIAFSSQYYLFGIVTKKNYYFTVFDSVENNTVFEACFKYMRQFYAKLIDRSIIFYRYFLNLNSYILYEVDVITGCIKFSSNYIPKGRMLIWPFPQIVSMEMSENYIFYTFYRDDRIHKFDKITQTITIIAKAVLGDNTMCAINNYLLYVTNENSYYFINVYDIDTKKIINKFQVPARFIVIEKINNTNSVSILYPDVTECSYRYIIYNTESHEEIQKNNRSIENLNDIIFGFIYNTYVIIGLDLSKSLILIYNLDHELILTINNPSQSRNCDGDDELCLVKVLNNKLIIKPSDSKSDMHIIKIDIDKLNAQIVGKIKYNLRKDNIMISS